MSRSCCCVPPWGWRRRRPPCPRWAPQNSSVPRSRHSPPISDLLAAERSRVKLLLVDDAQHLDPQAALLVRVLAAGAELTVIAGDANQAVFGYRGADPSLLRGDEPAIILTRSLRCAPVVADAITAVARRLPGADAARQVSGADDRPGSLTVRIAATPHAESALIADALRRAHLVDGVPWSQMAVIVRSVPRLGAALARALVSAGVPVESTAPNAPLADQPAVRALLTVLDATAHGLDGDRALSLLTGPIGRVDPVSLRQLRRALRRADGRQPPREFTELLVEALDNETEALSADQGRPLRQVRAVLAAARGVAPMDKIRATHCGGLASFRPAAALVDRQRAWRPRRRAGRPGPRCGDCTVRRTDQYVARTAGASLRGLIDHLRTDGAARDTRIDSGDDAVAVLSAHAALGRSGIGRHRRPTGRAVAQHCSPWRRAWHPAPVDVSTASSRRPTGDVEQRAAARRGTQAVDRSHGPRPQPPARDGGRQRQRRRVECFLRRSAMSWQTWRPIPTRTRRNRCTRHECWLRPRWSGGCVRWCAQHLTRSMMRYGSARQRNWRGWHRPESRAPTPPVVRHDAAVQRRAAVEWR